MSAGIHVNRRLQALEACEVIDAIQPGPLAIHSVIESWHFHWFPGCHRFCNEVTAFASSEL